MTQPRLAAIVRVTHWAAAIATVALIVSGVAILLAHPRLYWGETGAVGTPALIELPLPFVFGHSGWGRSLHFLAAWVSVASGMLYLTFGLLTRHFSRSFVPWNVEPGSYTVRQRVAYATVVFLLGPLVLLSGLAFSPALASVMPALVSAFGGQQSARTVHFFGGMAVVLFLVVHVTMVWLAGFRTKTQAMITGGDVSAPEHS